MDNPNMPRLKVRRIQFSIGGYTLYGYTDDGIDPVTGEFNNYLSGQQMANVIKNDQNTTRQNRMSVRLKALLGNDFTIRQGIYQMNSGGTVELNLWKVPDCVKYWNYHSFRGNEDALEILIALASTSLDIIINDGFKRVYRAGDAERMANARIAEMRDWVRINYDFKKLKRNLFPNEIKAEGFTGLEVSYIENEAYLQAKGDQARKILRTKNAKHRRTDLAPLIYSIQTGLERRAKYEIKLGATENPDDCYELILSQYQALRPKKK